MPQPKNTPPADETVEPLPGEQEPGWVAGLRNGMAELGRKLDGVNANVTDDDRRGIAEAVHGLFESSGAFHAPAEDDDQDDDEGDGEDVKPPAPEPERKTMFEKWFGKY